MTTTFTYRHAGPATECETCGEPSIYGFDMRTGTKVVVVCATCAAEATDSTPCETCDSECLCPRYHHAHPPHLNFLTGSCPLSHNHIVYLCRRAS